MVSFPKLAQEAKLNMTIPVEKGAKFVLYGPGEQPPPPPPGEPTRTIIRFQPGDWTFLGIGPE